MNVELNVAELCEKRTKEQSTASDEMQTVKGWKISARQCELITLGDRAAVDKFFEDNLQKLKKYAYGFIYHSKILHEPFYNFLEVGDLINQVYVDMRRGFLVMDMQFIGALISHSFRYAAVGGFGDELGAYEYKPRKRIEEVQ